MFSVFSPSDEKELLKFLQVRKAELEIINNLVVTDTIAELPDGNPQQDEKGNIIYTNLSLENLPDNDTQLQKLSNNMFYPLLSGIMRDQRSEARVAIEDRTTLGPSVRETMISKAAELKCGTLLRITQQKKDWILDTFGIDQFFVTTSDEDDWCGMRREVIEKEYESKCLMIESPASIGSLGQVWFFTSAEYPDYLGIYGLRGSILNLLFKDDPNRKSIAQKLLDQVILIAKENKKKKVIVPWPLPPMIPALLKRGFIEHLDANETPERMFLRHITASQHYFTLDI